MILCRTTIYSPTTTGWLCVYLMMIFVLGGPALFVLSWAIIKAFAVESENIDGVSSAYNNVM